MKYRTPLLPGLALLSALWLAAPGGPCAAQVTNTDQAVVDPLDEAAYMWSRDREYISYIEALDLSPETKDRLWQHLTRKYQAEAELDAAAARELGGNYAGEVGLLVITYDENSEHYQRLRKLRRQMDEELHQILTPEQLEKHQRFNAVKELERSRRKLRHQIEDMELDLSPIQFDVAMEVFQNKPAFFQQPPATRGAAGYSTDYVRERERWRFDQEQKYLEARLIPILNQEQVKRFQKWQEVQRIELNRSLDMYKASEEFMARLYPERSRRVKLLSPSPLAAEPEKKPLYIECRNNQLFRIPVEELRKRAIETLKDIAEKTKGTPRTLMQELATARVETDAYRVDLTYALLAQLALRPKPNARGYALEDIREERATDWYGRILDSANPAESVLTFVVRDDSLDVFERARALAEAKRLTVAYEVLDPIATIKFGLGGVPAIITDRPAEKRALPINNPPGKSPSYIDVYRDRIVLYPSGHVVRARDLEAEGNALDQLLADIQKRREDRYVVLIVHPRSAILATRLRKMLGRRGIAVAQQVSEEQPASTPAE